jgi:tetratricopeptide (TPR) repeat protein
MIFRSPYFRGALALLLILSMSGCLPANQGAMDEEKEPHFLEGRNAINSLDFKGAIEEFEKSLEVNPHNSRAHAQLGWLYEEKELDPASAIYHYQKYLRLRPDSHNAEVIRQHIMNCKQDLAKTVLPLPITPGMQRQFDQMQDELKRLREENERWKNAYTSLRSQVPTNPPNTAIVQSQPAVPPRVPASTFTPTAIPPRSRFRAHTVQAGETPAAISRKYGVRLDAMMAANPSLEPKRMRVGQVLNIPMN